MNWLTNHCRVMGLIGQNWMLVAGGGLLIYGIVVLFFEWHNRTRTPR